MTLGPQLQVDRYLESMDAHHARHYVGAIQDMLVAVVRGDRVGAFRARERLERVIRETMGIGEVLGAASMLREVAEGIEHEEGRVAAMLRADRRALVAFKEGDFMLSNVTFSEAVDDMVSRVPTVLQPAAARSAQAIARAYSQGRVVAFVRSAEQQVTERAQALIAAAMREGVAEAAAGTLLRLGVDEIRQETEAWSEGYARMVFRTNLNTAVTAGRFRQVQDPDVRFIAPCFQFHAVGDVDTRHNHEAATGRIWKVDNPVWNRLAPPLGYNCRCQVHTVTRGMLRRMGRLDGEGQVQEDSVPSTAFPDPGFRHTGRPDLFMVSA